jgi:predicted SnoaL-like aldol condensation-catalyzing enzyme
MAATTTLQKTAAEQFLQLVCRDVDRAYAEFVAPNFRHHNVWFPGNAEALKKGMADNLRQNPQKKLEIKQSIEEGDRVAVMSHVTFKPGDRGYSLMHLFRFEKGKIAELWDIAQEIPQDSPNANGAF